LEHGPDRALAQLARYMSSVRTHLSQASKMSGVIVARTVDDSAYGTFKGFDAHPCGWTGTGKGSN
jgi:hypothetical protein